MNETQATPKNIVLVGFMGSGKTTVGRELHQRLGYPLVDMDQVIEERAGKSIPAIFAESGEAGFREMETSLLNSVGVIHSNKAQNNRFATVQKFEKGDYTCLIATDIIARGLDVAEVTHVINFDIPDTPENYIHRIGRTGRADKKGIAISFATEKEMPFVEAIEQLMQQKIALQTMPETVAISDQLITEEMPVIRMKTDYIKPIKRAPDAGSAFHEKSAKNSKTNKKVSHKDKMQKKYGKPKKKR